MIRMRSSAILAASVVAEHRCKADEGLFSARLFVDRHERAVRLLAMFLEKERLHVVFPKRMTSREEKQVERRNDEFYSLYRRLREEGKRKTQAVEDAAVMCGYGKTRAWEIVGAREGRAASAAPY